MKIKVDKIKTKTIAKDTYESTLTISDDHFYFNAGQYVWVENPFGKKAFSIASSSDNQGEIKIIYRQGKSSFKSYLVEESDKYLFVSEGRGFLRVPEKNVKTTYIASGVGLAPVASILDSLVDKKVTETEINLISVNTEKEKEFYTEKFLNWQKNISNFNSSQLVTDYFLLNKINLDKLEKDSKFIVLGNEKFVDLVYSELISNNISDSNIFFEENYPSAYTLDIGDNSNSLFKLSVEQSITHMIITDVNGFILYANKAAENMTGYKFDEMIGQTPRLWGGLMEKSVYELMWKTIKVDRKPFVGELSNIKKDGTKYVVKASISPIIDSSGNLVGYVASEDDITKEKQMEENAKKINELTIDRELKMIELKERLKKYE